MSQDNKPFQDFLCMLEALEPVHVGSGSQRIGLVDNPLIREPHTQLPKIPGSTLAGAARAMAALKADSVTDPVNDSESKYLNCSGKGGADGATHCGQRDCPVCIPFGFSKGEQGGSFQGLAAFCDAHILFFPVRTAYGPIWITCPSALNEIPISIPNEKDDTAIISRDYAPFKSNNKVEADPRNSGINLGWRWFKTDLSDITQFSNKFPDISGIIGNQWCIVTDRSFGWIVNDGLELRTSVAINPETGAAEKHALFSYEAFPRSTIFVFRVFTQDPKHFRVPVGNGHEKTTLENCRTVYEKAVAGFDFLKYLGLGGMNTRGFGRLKFIKSPASK